MKLTYVKKAVKVKGMTYTIIIPDNIDGFINNQYMFDADREGLTTIMLSTLMMIKDKNIILYFPVQKNKLPKFCYPNRGGYTVGEKIIYDVVFVSHSVQMSISSWKEIRKGLKYAKADKGVFKVNISTEYDIYTKEFEKYKKTTIYYQSKDVFCTYKRFQTYFFVGGHFSFMDLFISLKEMLDLPLEDNFKKGDSFDYTFFYDKERDYPEIGFYDARFEKQRYIENKVQI